jgi:hypothetical protein
MRTIVVGLVLVLGYAIFQDTGSSEDDVYSLKLVEHELRMRTQETVVIHSWTQKRIARLGDAVGIALLKILSDTDLKNPSIIKAILPIIRQSFAAPTIVTNESDRQPKVTLFLLKYLDQNVGDAGLRREIQETARFVDSQTYPRGAR